MEQKREQAVVGLFVIVATALLVFVVFLLSGTFNRGNTVYKAYFKNAGGVGPGSEVHYAGMPSAGRVQKIEVDPNDPARVEIDFDVKPDVPVKTDSVVIITSNSPLGDNFLGIKPGSAAAPRAQAGATLKSQDYTSLDDIKAMLAQMGPSATKLLDNLNDRTTELKETIARVNDVLNDKNRANISGSIANLNGMLQEDRPLVHSSLEHVNESTAKLSPLIDQFHKTATQANDTLKHVDDMIGEDRPELHQAILNMKQALASANHLVDQLNQTMDANSENLDEIIDNLRHVTENLNSFTETIKTRPYTLIRASGEKPHSPGEALPK
ncbi:MAG TPA: MlaD family protein [Candidatus Acidoferrales bacterium]|nr:MlaD family protein [Candidatus Acidoferrales bacterium]